MTQRSTVRRERHVVPFVLAAGLVVLFLVSIRLVYPTLVIGAGAFALGLYYWRSRERVLGPAFALLGLIMAAIATVVITKHANAMEPAITLWP